MAKVVIAAQAKRMGASGKFVSPAVPMGNKDKCLYNRLGPSGRTATDNGSADIVWQDSKIGVKYVGKSSHSVKLVRRAPKPRSM